jgi:hypothetical protein
MGEFMKSKNYAKKFIENNLKVDINYDDEASQN